MTVLSYQTIKKLGIINPCHEKQKAFGMSYGLSSCGYDLTIDLDGSKEILPPFSIALVAAIEHFTMPINVVGVVHDKSTWARKFLTVQNTVIEPGWNGFLTLELINHSDKEIELFHGMPIAQVLFHFLDEPTQLPYNGKYQNQKRGPQVAIEDV